MVLGTAWNILGGLTRYVNFGSVAFFALGVCSSAPFYNLFKVPVNQTPSQSWFSSRLASQSCRVTAQLNRRSRLPWRQFQAMSGTG